MLNKSTVHEPPCIWVLMGVMILALDPDQQSDFQYFGDSRSGSSKKWNRNNSNPVRPVAGGSPPPRTQQQQHGVLIGEVEGGKQVQV